MISTNTSFSSVLFLSILSILCGILQIIGLMLIMMQKYPMIIFLSGFAAFIKYYIPLPNHQTTFNRIVSFAGIGIMGIAIISITLPPQ